jgi:hypothetical protein
VVAWIIDEAAELGLLEVEALAAGGQWVRARELRKYMWRRAEFARRCGDADESAHWQTRAAALLELAKTEDDQLLLDALRI